MLLTLAVGEEVAQPVEILFHDDANALCVQRGVREIAVVGLVIGL